MVVTRPPLLSSQFLLPHTANSSSNTSTASTSVPNSNRSRTARKSSTPIKPFKEVSSVPIFQFQKAFEVDKNHGGQLLRSRLSPPLLAIVLTHPIDIDVSEIVGEEVGTHLGPHSYSAPYVRSLSTLLRRKFDREDEQDAFNQRQQQIEMKEQIRAIRDRLKFINEKRDVLSEVGMLHSQLIKLGLKASSWIEIQSSNRICLARLRLLKEDPRKEHKEQEDEDVGCLFLSPALHFYLGLSSASLTREFVQIRKCMPELSPQSPFHSSNMFLESIPCAKRVHISLVRTPISIKCKSEVQDRGLKLFFSGQPILKLGQVFGVPLRKKNYWLSGPSITGRDIEEEEEEEDDDERDETGEGDMDGQFLTSSQPLLYFQVTDVEPPYVNFRVESSMTALVVSDQVRSRVPYNLEEFLASSPRSISSDTISAYSPFSSSYSLSSASAPSQMLSTDMVIPGLQSPSDQLTAKLQPFLHPLTSSLRLTSAVLLIGARRSGKRILVSQVARKLGLHLIEKNAYELLGGTDAVTAENIRNLFSSAKTFAPVIVHCRRLGAFKDKSDQNAEGTSLAAALGEVLSRINQDGSHLQTIAINSSASCKDPLPVLFVGSCENLDEVPTSLKVLFTHTISVGEAPDLTLRKQLFTHFLQGVQLQEGLEDTAKTLAGRTAGLSPGEIHALIADAGRVTLERGERTISRPTHVTSKKMQQLRTRLSQLMNLSERFNTHNERKYDSGDSYMDPMPSSSAGLKDFEDALNNLQNLSENATATAKIPDVKWSDVGGLQHVKREVMDTIELPLKRPELFASGLKQRKGILLYGPPGTGKTLIAKAVANECSLNFISVKGPELLNMYIGESEKNIREVFARARSCKPCVLFFDEIDSLAPARGHGSDGGGVMDRVVSQLLTELDGMNANNDVFIIAATNRPDLLDSALLRPGRLDRCVYLGVGDSPEQQLNILSALTRKFRLSPETDLMKLANEIPLSYSGADLYALCSDAMLYALKRKIAQVDGWVEKLNLGAKEPVTAREVLSVLEDSELAITVTMADFLNAKAQLTPSLSADELAHYRTLQAQFSSRSIK